MRFLLFFFFALVLSSCCVNSSYDRELDRVSALLPSDPTAALDMLNACEVEEFEDSATMARWALLYSEALVANHLWAPTDTIVNYAISYYGAHSCDEQFRHASRLKSLLAGGGECDRLATALYLQKEREFRLYKERVGRTRLLYAALSVFVLCCGVIVWQRQRLRLRDAQNEALVAEASSLLDSLKRNESMCGDLRDLLVSTLGRRFDVIDDLCQIYYESQGTKSERKVIAEKVKSQIEELRSDTGLFAEMERCVNDCHGGLLDELRAAFPDLKPDEYRLAVYLASNLSNRSIAALTGVGIDVVYKRKSRLKAKIASPDQPLGSRFAVIF